MKRHFLKVNFHINTKVKPHRVWRRGGPSRMIKFARMKRYRDERVPYVDWLEDDKPLYGPLRPQRQPGDAPPDA